MKCKRLFMLVVATLLLFAAAVATYAQAPRVTFYVTIEGMKQGRFKGESPSPMFRDKIPGYRFSYQVGAPRDVATGQATGKRQHAPVIITKEWGPATPQIFEALTTNEVLRTVLIEFVRSAPNGTEEVYQTIKLTNATVSSIRMHINEPRVGEPPDNRAFEDVSFTFQKIEMENRAGRTTAVDEWTR